jgi:NAD-dependent deacetylase
VSAEALAALIVERGPCVVLTGAGMSTESGIPDFRSATGIWADVDPFEVASIDAFRRDPGRVWRWYGPRIRGLLEAQPNRGHLALAALERAGHVRAVVTQNIDTLHARAGSEGIVEVHGSIQRAVCLACGRPEPIDALLAQLEDDPVPVCRACGNVPKPDVVMFGEMLPVDAFERAEQLVLDTDALVVVGSSLQVWPVAGLPESAVAHGGAVALVNDEATAFDSQAAIVVRGSAGATLASVAALLGCNVQTDV